MIILDNVFNNIIVSKVFSESVYSNTYIHLYHRSTDSIEDTGRISCDLTNKIFFYKYMRLLLEKKIQKNFYIKRIYLNIMSYGNESGFHFDSLEPNAYTFLYFFGGPNDKIEADQYGGYFYYKEKEEIKCIEPLNNRLIFFKGNLIHKASCYKRMITKPRLSIAWKVYIKNL